MTTQPSTSNVTYNNLIQEHRNVTLVLGNTGAEKSTLIQWIAGDNNKLISKEVQEGSGEFIIEDGNRIGSSINSETLFPELIVDSKTNTAYYDCPGFSDTRSSSYDIPATYCIKKLTDHTRNVKLLLVIDYPAVRKGVDRQHFINLMRYTTDLIENIEKFKDSIAILVIKVDNQFVEERGNLSIVPDETVIELIAHFLLEVRQGLEIKLKNTTSISNEEKLFFNNGIKLVNVLRTKNNKNYTRIGIFRRPDESGPLSNITLLQQGKKHVEKILYEVLKFTQMTYKDFGSAISERSKNDINILVERINDKVWFEVSQIVEKVQNHYRNLIEEIYGRINSVVNNSGIIHVKVTEAQVFLAKLNIGHHVISRLITKGENVTNLEVLSHLGITNYTGNINNIVVQVKYLDFLQVFSNKKLNIRPWSSLFQKIKIYLSNSKRDIEKDVYKSAEKIGSKIKYNVKNITREIETLLYLEKIESLEIKKLPDELYKGVLVTSNLIQKTNNLSSRSRIHGKYLEFLKYLNNGDLDTWSSDWVISFNNNTARNLVESEIWYKYLGDLYARGNQYITQGIKITEKNFQTFIEKIKWHDITEYNDIINNIGNKKIKQFYEDEVLSMVNQEYDIIRNIEVTESRLEILNNVLRSTHDHKIETLCPESNKLIIRGDFIKFSNFISTDGKVVNLCRNGFAISSVEIFALNTIFIDRDFQEIGSRLQFSIVAPRWQIIGTRRINLDGAPGIAHQSSKAAAGSKPGDKGINGLPGIPGGPGGNFFGIGKEFLYNKDSNLIVSTNGGKGGPGQHGGDGATGIPGIQSLRVLDSPRDLEFGKDVLSTANYEFNVHMHIIYGTPGGAGGDGGFGGSGGFGGINGNIRIVELDGLLNAPNLILHFNPGSSGIDGKDGDPGDPGKDGDSIFVNWCDYENFVHERQHYDWCTPNSYNARCVKKENKTKALGGWTIANTNGMKQAEGPIVYQSISNIINNYKIYLRENLGDTFKKHSLIQFITQLDSNVVIKNSYGILGLVAELKDLEIQFHSLYQSVDLLPFYQSLLYRTSEYAQHPKSFENSKQYKKVLSYLYTAILSKISTLKIDSESNLITDLENYLNIIKHNINSLANLREERNKVNVINQHRKAYKANIDKHIREAENYIVTQVTSEIDNINTLVEHNIDLLINETITLQKKAREKEEQLLQKKRELENALATSWILSGLKMFGQKVDCFGILESVIGLIISSTSQVAESLSLDGKGSYTTKQLPVGVVSNIKSIQNKIMSIETQKIIHFKNQLENISTELNKHPEKLCDTSAKVKNLITSCKVAQNSPDVNKIKELEQELKQELSRKANELKNQNSNTDKEIDSATAVITRFNQVIKFGTVGFNIYNKYKNDTQKVEIIDGAIEQAKDKIQQLEQYENKIHEAITLMLRSTGNYLNNIASQLNNKSQVMLNITQWQVQSFLKHIKLQMRQFTKGFTVEENLRRCIEKLEETMTTLINIYDRIQNYQEQQQLAVYIADISSPTANRIVITNQNVINAIRTLEIIIRSSLIINQYKAAVNALTQQVFPFAHRYLAESRMPSDLQWKAGFQNLVSIAVKEVKTIESKIIAYKIAIKDPDVYISNGWFNRDYVSAQPFIIWENNKNQHTILKLLAGDKVLLKANILNSSFEKDAIKFDRIEINLYSENSTVTSEISNKLEGFIVSATHLGNSYYRYNNKIYIITSDSQNIQFSFKTDTHGEPVHKNRVYDKIKSGDLMLSPYAMWEIQLINATNKINFSELIIYKDKVNLELVGHGSYVTRGTNISNIDIEKYYKAVETISESAPDDNSQEEFPINNRTRRQLPGITSSASPPMTWEHSGITSSASRPTSWITTLWRGVWGILAVTVPSLPQTTHSQAVPDYTTGHLQGGLQLLDLIIRKWTGQKYSSLAFTQKLNTSDKHRIMASELAYAAYCPEISKFKQNLTTAEVHKPQSNWLAYPFSHPQHNAATFVSVVRETNLNFPNIV